MRQGFLTELHSTLPPVRLQRYRPAPTDDLETLTNYFWNLALSESLIPSFHGVELAIRNTVNDVLKTRFSRTDWWNDPHSLKTKQREHVRAIREALDYQSRTPVVDDQVVAGLSFGFWTTVLSQPYDSRIWSWNKAILLPQAFPHSGQLSRHEIHRRFNSIRLFRNRVMHHECIFDHRDIARDHRDIHEAIRWISPALHTAIHTVDSFPDVFQSGRDRVRAKLDGIT